MKITIVRAQLVRLLTQCSLVAKPKTTSPVLSCCLLETTAKGLSGVATDLYQSVSTFAPCDVATAGGVAVNARELLERVKTLPEGPVTVETEKDRLRIHVGKRRHLLPCIDASEFPPVATGAVNGFQVAGATLGVLLRRTKPMARTETDRMSIHSVLLECEPGKLGATATDGHRVSTLWLPAANVAAGPPKLLSLEAVDVLLGLLDDEKPVTIASAGDELAIDLGDALTFYTKLIADPFVPYRNALADKPENEIRVSRAAFSDALHSVDKSSDKGFCSFTATTGLVTLKAEGRGASDDEVEAFYDGQEVTLSVNGRYVLDALGTIDTEEVRINVGRTGSVDAMWFRPADDTANIQVVMPVHPGHA